MATIDRNQDEARIGGVVAAPPATDVARDPLARLARRFPDAPMVVMGALIGGFLIGRPFSMFCDAAESARRDMIWYPVAPWA